MKNYKRIGISIGVLLMIAMSTACGSENISRNNNEEHRALKTAEAAAAAEEKKTETTETTVSSEESKTETTKAVKSDEESKAESKAETTKPDKSPAETKAETTKSATVPAETKAETTKPDKSPAESKAETTKSATAPAETKAEETKPATTPAETKTETTNTFTSPAETKAETKETKVNNEIKNTKNASGYSQLLDWYYNQISTEWSDYDLQKSGYGVAKSEDSDDTVSYMWCGYEKPDMTNSGYQFKDINHDGVDELVVGKKENENSDTIYDLYTIYDGEIVRIASSGERDKFYVQDDTIHERGSGSAAHYGHTRYRLVDGKAVPFEHIEYNKFEDEENPFFYSNEPVASEMGGYEFRNMQHITEEEMNRMDYYETDDIDLQLFSDYKTTNNE